MLRHRVEDRAAPGATGYLMRQQVFSIGDDFWIETAGGMRAFKVDGKALRVRKTLLLETPDGRERYKIQQQLLHIRDTMAIEGPSGTAATVKKALFTPLRERYTVELAGGTEWDVQGNIVDHAYEIKGPDGKVGEVGKKWLRARDTYSIEVMPGHDDALVIAVAIVVDAMSHPTR